MDDEVETRFVEGVGNELLWAFGFLLVIIVVLLIYTILVSGTGQIHTVHPRQQEVVERAREQIRRAPTSGNNDQQQILNNAEQIQCSVCLGPITYPVETNCGHSFCAECILAYWHADRWPSACRCPVCRREVTLLLSDQWFERNGRYPAGITHQIQDYNMRMSGQLRPILSYIYDIPTLLRHLWNDLFTLNGLVCMHRLHILLVLILLIFYVFLPYDILPESVIGIIGYIDDFIILIVAFIYLTLIYRAYITNRRMAA